MKKLSLLSLIAVLALVVGCSDNPVGSEAGGDATAIPIPPLDHPRAIALPDNYAFTVAPDGNSVKISWGAVDHADTYDLELEKIGGSKTTVSSLTVREHTFNNVAAGNYQARVWANDTDKSSGQQGPHKIHTNWTAFTISNPSKLDQEITLEVPASVTYGDGPFVVKAIASSGLEVDLLIPAADNTVTPAIPASNCTIGAASKNETTGKYEATVTITGAGVCVVTAKQDGNDTYNAISATRQITINKATPTINWSNPANIVYGTQLSSTQLNATVSGVGGASVAGNLVYDPAAGALLNAGNHTLSVGFTPTGADANNYNSAQKSVSLTVEKATPVITWSNPAAIVYGTPLSGDQLNAAADVPGSFLYTPAAGTVLLVGTRNLKADFTPTDTDNYNLTSKTVQIQVLPWKFGGFYNPVAMNAEGTKPTDQGAIFNTVKGGATVPLKFNMYASQTVGENEQTSTTGINFAASKIACPNTTMQEDQIEFTTTGNTSLRYDLTERQFVQNWKTPTGSNVCYSVTMTAPDGSPLKAFFKTK